jgi:hypothetical protein
MIFEVLYQEKDNISNIYQAEHEAETAEDVLDYWTKNNKDIKIISVMACPALTKFYEARDKIRAKNNQNLKIIEVISTTLTPSPGLAKFYENKDNSEFITLNPMSEEINNK